MLFVSLELLSRDCSPRKIKAHNGTVLQGWGSYNLLSTLHGIISIQSLTQVVYSQYTKSYNENVRTWHEIFKVPYND